MANFLGTAIEVAVEQRFNTIPTSAYLLIVVSSSSSASAKQQARHVLKHLNCRCAREIRLTMDEGRGGLPGSPD